MGETTESEREGDGFGTANQQIGEYSEKLGRRVTAHPCECSAASRHTVQDDGALKCDHCGDVKEADDVGQ